MAVVEKSQPVEAQQGESRASRRHLIMFGICTFMYWACLYVYVPILPVYAERLGASKTMVGLIIGAYGIAQLFGRIPLGIISDRIGWRKPFLLIGLIAAALGSLWLGLTPTPEGLFAARMLTGVGAAAWVAFTVLFSSYFAHGGATRAISLISAINGAAQMVATFAGGIMAQELGWQSPFYAGMLIALVGIAALPFIHEKRNAKPSTFSLQRFIGIGRVPLLLIVSGIAALMQWSNFVTTFGFVPTFAAQRLDASRADLGILTMVSLGAFTLSTILTSFLAGKIGNRTLIVGGLLLVIAGTAVVPFTWSLDVLMLTQVAVNFGRALAFPVLMGLSIQAVQPSDRATAMGIFQSLYSLGMLLGPSFTGALADVYGLDFAFYSAAAFSVAAAAIAFVTVKNKRIEG